MTTAEDAQRLRNAVARARAARGLRDNTALAVRAGVGYRTLVNLLAGKPTRAEDAVELALGWAAGSIRAVLAGGEPVEAHEGNVSGAFSGSGQLRAGARPVGPATDTATYVATGSGGRRDLNDYSLAELADEIRRRADEGA